MNAQRSEKFIATHHSIHLLLSCTHKCSFSLPFSLTFNINIIFLFCCSNKIAVDRSRARTCNRHWSIIIVAVRIWIDDVTFLLFLLNALCTHSAVQSTSVHAHKPMVQMRKLCAIANRYYPFSMLYTCFFLDLLDSRRKNGPRAKYHKLNKDNKYMCVYIVPYTYGIIVSKQTNLLFEISRASFIRG